MNFAQTAPTIEWDKTYGDKKNDIGYSILENSDHGYTISAGLGAFGGANLWVFQTDPEGTVLNEKVTKTIYIRNKVNIIRTSDNGFATANMTLGSDDGRDFGIIKYNSSLNESWAKSVNAKNDNSPASVIATSDGGLIMIGNSVTADDDVFTDEKYEIQIVKIDTKGNKDWQKSISKDTSYIYSAIETKDGNYIMVGSTRRNNSNDFYMAKIDSRGNLLWDKNYGSTVEDIAHSVIQTADNGFILTGITYSSGFGDIWVIKTDSNGNKIWDKRFGGNKQEDVSEIIATDDNGYIIAGSTKSKGAGSWDFWILKIDELGNLIWDKTFGGSEDEKAYGITNTFDNGLAVIGFTDSKGGKKKNVWLVKLKFSIRERATQYVQEKINSWQTKGKYEKVIDFKARVNENTRLLKIYQLTNEFYNKIGIPIFEKDIKLAYLEYDTESEVFKITLDYLNPIYVPVPIKNAEKFETNFNKMQFSNHKFDLTQDDKLEISNLTITDKIDNKTYFFDASKPVVFNNETIVVDFDPIEIEPNNDIAPPDNNQNSSDIDENIPNTGNNYPNRYALIIGNGHYIENGSDMVDIKYSINDAKIFRQYAVNVLGVPNDNNHIYYIEDANATYIKLYIDNFAKLIKSKDDNSEFYVYYSGHGTQNDDNEAFLVPVGVTSDYIEDFGVKLSDFYMQISPDGNKKVIVFLDACFSGGGKNGQLLINAKTGLRRTANNSTVNSNILIFAASSEKQISQEYLEKKHGLFTYFLLKTLKETKGNINYEELTKKVKDYVSETALNPQNKLKEQTPTINISPAIQNTWKTWKVNP